ncbi:MAG: sugar ABC transporter permease [Paenibacillaceae bacterium]|nr:sugar ABC transporter permease [Paenibacillaceae bacterium]
MFYLMILPGLLTLLVFNYGPVYGIQLAFKNFMYNKGIMGSPWVGWDNFLYLWYDSGFWRALRNTFVISFGKLIFYFPAPIIVALLLNELRSPRFKRIIQSLLYIPHFFSWVIVSGIFVSLFSSTSGVLSKVSFELLGHRLPPMIVDPDYFLTIIFSTSVWHGVGWGTIIYLAAISGVNPELYESAVMDGANRFKQAIYITLPSIKFAIVMTLILSLGGTMNAGFDQIFNFYSPPTYEVGDIIDTYVYRKGIIDAGYGVSTAVGLFKSVINCALLFSANWFVKRLGEEGVF